jgi:hypothetical protein
MTQPKKNKKQNGKYAKEFNAMFATLTLIFGAIVTFTTLKFTFDAVHGFIGLANQPESFFTNKRLFGLLVLTYAAYNLLVLLWGATIDFWHYAMKKLHEVFH